MSLINEKNYDLYDYKPTEIDNIISEKHNEYKDSIKILQHNCPACKSDKYDFTFDKYDFHYVQCKECMSLYIQNRLNKNDVVDYEQYLQTELYSTDKYNTYMETLSCKISFELELTFSRLFSKKQSLSIAYLGNKSKVYKNVLKNFSITFYNIKSIETLENEKYDLVIIDHFLEKSNDLVSLMQNIHSSLKSDGMIYITMRVGSGIDILTLWEDSKIYPLEHNNLLSIDGVKILLGSNDFIVKELNTPGVLDIDNILQTKSDNVPRFLNYLKNSENKKAIVEFQTFIQKSLLSSFATIIAQRG